jgi:hypothetical protein
MVLSGAVSGTKVKQIIKKIELEKEKKLNNVKKFNYLQRATKLACMLLFCSR